MHASKKAFPWLGCKGADTIVILKWLQFFLGLLMSEDSWSPEHKRILNLMLEGSKAGLSFSQGIHGHGIWLKVSCVKSLRRATRRFGHAYVRLAAYCVEQGYTLFGMVPKLHAKMHYQADFDDSIRETRQWTLNPAAFDNSMSEDFIGRIARQSRRISFRNIEKSILLSYQTKAHFVIDKFKKRRLG